MKKLMIALASAATAVFAFGEDVLPHGADFESANYTAGENFTNYVNKADDGVATSGNRYWYSTSDDIGVISNHQAGISVKSVPDLYENATPTGGVNYLQLDTQTRLFRTIANNDQSGSFTGVDMSTGDGVYLDTLVKFTAADAAFGTDALEEADKIAIEYVEREIEYGTGDEATVVKVTPLTNFVVRAGFIGSAFATNYLVDVPNGWLENNMKDDWHRLTVRALTNIDGNNRAGFKIYLDEVPLVYRTDKDEFAQSAGFEDDTHTIFPSAVASGVNKTTISAVAFSGNGSIDDVVFTTTKPKFIAESEAVVVPFVADAGVTAISVLPDGATDAILVDMTADTLVAVLPAQTTAFTVTATIDTANGYEFVSMTVGDADYNTNPASVTGYAGGDITITTIRNNFNLFDENGDPIQGTFQTLSEALAKDGVAKIVLVRDYDVNLNETVSASLPVYTVARDVTLDLGGETLNGGSSNARFLFSVSQNCTLTVIDSVAGDAGSIVYGGTYGIFGGAGDIYIGSNNETDYGVVVDGSLVGESQGYVSCVIRGKFSVADNTVNDEFVYFDEPEDLLDINSTAERVGEYWVVTPKGGSEPTEIAVPTAKTDLVYDGTEKIGVVVGTGYTLTGNIATNAGNYTATATLEAGYVWSDTTTEAKSINWSIAVNAGATVDLTLASEIAEYTELLDFPAVTAKVGTEDVTGTPVWDPAKISEPNAGETNTYTVTFTVMNGGYTGSTGTATFKVYKKASSGGWEPDPSKIDPSATAAETYSELAGTALATANAQKLTEWAAAESIDFATVTGDADAYVDAFLLNCAPAEVEAAKADFKATITVNADGTVTVTASGDYNVTPTIQGKESLSDSEWHAKTDGDQFFRAVLSL